MSGDDPRHRLGLIAVTAISLFGALFARLWFLQVVEGSTLEAAASRNATRTVVIPGPRGRILDRNGAVLVDDRESIVVGISWQEFNDMAKGRQTRILNQLARTLSLGKPPAQQVSVKFLRQRLNDTRFSHFRPVPVAEDISTELEILLREQTAQFPSVSVERQTVRNYPNGSLAAHVLGYVGALSDEQWKTLKEHNDRDKPYVQTDEIGKSGVESTYEQYLRGTPGKRVYEVNRQNKVIGEVVSERVAPKPGNDLYLSIDIQVQAATERSLRQGLDQRRQTGGELGYYPAEAGGAAVIDPRDGQVRAMASYPTYDPSTLVGGISCPEWRDLNGLPAGGSCKTMAKEISAMPAVERPVSKLINRAIVGAYPPGSTFKLATAFAAMKLGILTPEKSLYDSGTYLIPGCSGSTDDCTVSSPVAESGGGSVVNLSKALTVSSDVYFYDLGNDSWALYKQQKKAGPTALQDQIAKLGFGKKTGIDLPSESAGRLPTPAWLKKFDKALNGKATEAGNWSSGMSINLAIGQGDMLATPLQMANAYAAFANDGTLYEPTVAAKITAPNKPDAVVKTFGKQELGKVDWGSASDRAALATGFEGVPQTGTAHVAFEGFPLDSWPTAGKTGTAQSGDKNHRKEDHSWYVGYGPTASPEYVAAVIMEHSGAGGSASAPAVRRVFEAIADGTVNQVDPASLARPDALGALRTGTSTPTDGSTDGSTGGSTTTTLPYDGTGTTGTTEPEQDGGTITPIPGSGD